MVMYMYDVGTAATPARRGGTVRIGAVFRRKTGGQGRDRTGPVVATGRSRARVLDAFAWEVSRLEDAEKRSIAAVPGVETL